MSDVSVDIIKNRNGEAPDLPSGANLSGVSTAATLQVTNLNPTHINASGVTTATTFSGSLKSTGTPTLGLGVTINSSGINISGVATAGIVSATTLYGDGSNLTGVAMSIAPISYNPDIGDSSVGLQPGIGITFTERIKAGSGNITLSVATNAGAAGTFVEAFGVGSSVTINNNTLTFTPTSNLTALDTYHVGIPAGAVTNTSGDVSLVATNWTFQARNYNYQHWSWGSGSYGNFGNNTSGPSARRSSPVQIPGTDWTALYPSSGGEAYHKFVARGAGTLFATGMNNFGQLGDGSVTYRSSPTQIPGTTWGNAHAGPTRGSLAVKTDGTMWTWGNGHVGFLGHNQPTNTDLSSPTQIPGTTWSTNEYAITSGSYHMHAIKTDGTMWGWGNNSYGYLGDNTAISRSSPVQIFGGATTWSKVTASGGALSIKTDGTLWSWGWNGSGMLGLNQGPSQLESCSSPVQVPGTTWSHISAGGNCAYAVKTDGTLWSWGVNDKGNLGQNNRTKYSSPTQIPGTTWNFVTGAEKQAFATKTDGTLWSWGYQYFGVLGQNQGGETLYSSPVQIPGTTWSTVRLGGGFGSALKAL